MGSGTTTTTTTTTINPFKDQLHHHHQYHYSFTKKLLPWALYALLPLALLRLYFHPLLLSHQSDQSIEEADHHQQHIITVPSSIQVKVETPCDYTNGRWVHDNLGPLYNGSTCGTIKDGQNCINHGRPDLGYLYWRWKPKKCKLSRFDPTSFLRLLENKHLAFVGDSMARNQLESLLCLLSTVSTPDLVYRNGEDNKFRRWHFPSHNVNVSIYWSPFLVKGIEKSNTGFNHNKLYLDSVDDGWAMDLEQMDMIVLSVGHWFLHPAVYYEEKKDDDSVLGCHYCEGLNHTEIGFYDVFRKAVKTTLEAIIDKRSAAAAAARNGLDVILTTFSPSHFEGEWDKAGACPRKRPFKVGEKAVEGMNAEMRTIEVEEVGVAAKEKATKMKAAGLRVEALDVTKLSFMRPDGHPGPYMYPFPFANGVPERVQNDCVHWCLPGPIDTWNEILLDVMKRWIPPQSVKRGV